MNMKKIVVLTGAGMSAESGISTFRDSDGLWENHPVEDVASIDGFRRNPKLVLDFYNARRRSYVGCKPNAAHMALAEMQSEYDVQIVTQNVDDLHERAGSKHVIHLHGELMKNCSVVNTEKTYPINPDKPDLEIGDLAPDGHQLRPFIVWFGEAVPMMERAVELVSKADLLLIIGTSLNVYPAAGLMNYAPKTCPIFLIDPKPARQSIGSRIEVIQATATQGMPIFLQKLKELQL